MVPPWLAAFLVTAFLATAPLATTPGFRATAQAAENPTQAAQQTALPQVRVVSIQRVFHNGEHNAFTDLCRYRDTYYLTFRSCPHGHGVNPTASIIVLASDDGRTWRQVNRFHVEKRDTRDPHFLLFDDKLFVYTGTWYCGDSAPKDYDMNQQLGYAAWTDDGRTWHGPTMLEGTYGQYIWRTAAHDGKAYLCGRRKRQFAHTETRQQRDPIVESALLESDDGLTFKPVGLFQERYGDETDFLFEEDGSILAVARSGGGRNAQVCRAAAPTGPWERIDLDRYIGGPLLTRWQGHYLVGGRKTMGAPARTALYWLVGNRLEELAELPSGGDNSYPGFVAVDAKRAWVSYYSSHEKDDAGRTITAIYLAELELAPATK
jgi:hypothetical protein